MFPSIYSGDILNTISKSYANKMKTRGRFGPEHPELLVSLGVAIKEAAKFLHVSGPSPVT